MTRRRPCLDLAGLLLVALLALGGCGGGGGGGSGGAQLFFLIASSTPASNALSAPLESVVTVQFNTALNTGTITPDTIIVTPFAGGDPIAGFTALVDDTTDLRVRWTATELLSENTHYRCTINAALRGADGSVLAPPTSFRFSTTPDPTTLDIPQQGHLRTLAARLNLGRQAHAAVRLNDGRVLVTGGYTIGLTVTPTAELFSTGTETFTAHGSSLAVGRAGHTMTLLADGRVLICGGYAQAGAGQVTTTATAEIFDPSSGLFTTVGSMGVERADHASVLLPDGTVLVTGGSRLAGGFLTDHASAEIFDPSTGLFAPHASAMIHTRATHGLVDVGNGRYVLGGGSDVDFRSSFFSTTQDRFVDIGQGASDRGRFGAMMARFDSGGVVIAGGDTLGTVMYINGSQSLVQNTGSALRFPRAYGTATQIGEDRIFVVGGLDFSRGGFIERSCDIIFEGGIGGSRTFATPVRFPTGMAYHTATVLAGGRVLYCGGLNENGSAANLNGAYILSVPSP